MKKYTFDEVVKASEEYFNGDRMAAETFARKYALKNKDGEYVELTPDDMHWRLAKEFARVEAKFGGDAALKEHQIFDLFRSFDYIVPQGSPMAAIGNLFNLMSASNCTVVASPEDNIESIMETARDMAQLHKHRAGCGLDLSNLRPTGAAVSNSAGSSSGVATFADFYSHTTRMIGQSGRIGATMITLDVMHPDSPIFATMKLDLKKVTGANVSLRITDEFMKAVEKDKEITLRWPLEGEAKIKKKIRAVDLWNTIVESATKSGEPGLLMWDTYCDNLPAHQYEHFKSKSTNPCSEISLSAYDSCRLISMNLVNYVKNPFTKEAAFDIELFKKHVEYATRLSDDLVELELELVSKIREKSDSPSEIGLWDKMYEAARRGRRTGLGTHGLGDVFARLGVKYGSPESKKIATEIYSTFRNQTYTTSVDLANERGAFPEFNWETEKNCEFFKRMPKDLVDRISKYGRRNISLLTNAPTGSTSLMSRTSSGVEPIFRFNYTRRVKIRDGETSLQVDFIDELGDKWHNYQVYHPAFVEYCQINNIKLDISKPLKDQNIQIPEFFSTSDQLDYEANIDLIGAIQSYIDHGISITLNMPQGSTPEMVKNVYLKAWKVGMKGVTVYVDGSRSGVLVSDKPDKNIIWKNKRPQDVPCDIHITMCGGKRWLVIVGLLNGAPYEVFAGRAADLPMPREITKAVIRKAGKRQYSIVYKEDNEEVFVPIKEGFVEPQGMLIRLLMNQSLRHGVPLDVLSDTVSKSSDITDFSRTVTRILKKYIPENTTLALKCKNCGSSNMKLVDGCPMCLDCLYSKCS